jgi:putative phosphoribosyl transferase
MLASLPFRNRAEAGRFLADRLKPPVADQNAIVLALPRGGVPVGFEVARVLHADLDVFLVRKLGVPGQEELAMGAIASGGVRVLNDTLIRQLLISQATIDQVTARERQEIDVRERAYRNGKAALPLQGRTVVLVDDGLATGATMLAAARAVRAEQPNQIIVAVPVASRQACDELRHYVDQVICGATPEPFDAVGAWYQDFSQTSDAEVRDLLERASGEGAR